MSNRYDVTGNPETEYQPGSNNRVLLNKLGVVDPDEMDDIELTLLDSTQTRLLDEIELDQRLTSEDLCNWHKAWLEAVYPRAGHYRSVNMQKDDYPFAAANFIPKLMADFDKRFLAVHTPCDGMDEARLVDALGICHIEFIVIHPFREGNGRLSRVLATVMALQAGMPPLDFSWMAEHKREYFAAIEHGHAGNYGPIRTIFSTVLQASTSAG